MSEQSRRRNVILVLLLVVALLLSVWCVRKAGAPSPKTPAAATAEAETTAAQAQPGEPVPSKQPAEEVLTPATLEAPQQVGAGAVFSVTWTGPKNERDYITIVKRGAADGEYANYRDTKQGSPLELTAPIEPGEWELRYMTGQGAKVLGRRPIRIVAAEVSLSAPVEAAAGSKVNVEWTGPDNGGDYITVVSKDTPDGQYGNYAVT